MTYYVYIVECSDGSFYTGVTNNLDRRVWEHNEGIDPESYTSKKRPVILRYSERFENPDKAIAREKQLKGWSRKKKEALIQENWDLLQELSKSRSSNQSSTSSD
jgi:putative endonuclease